MPEMVLNEASFAKPASSLAVILPLLADVARGMASLAKSGRVVRVLRLRNPLHEIICAPHTSLYDAMCSLLHTRQREEAQFLMQLSQKLPLLQDLPESVVDRFRACEAIQIDPALGEPLVICAHTAAVAVSLPLDPPWDRDQLTIEFIELQPNGAIEKVTEAIDNLARFHHSALILDRHRAICMQQLTLESFWQLRETVFPRLKFGLDVDDQIRGINPGLFATVVNRLEDIHQAANDWKERGGAVPPWRCRVTAES